MDWPSVKEDIQAAGFSEADPLPIPDGIDLGQLAASQPQGRASTTLNWEILDSKRFEELIYDLTRALPGYQNVQLLMKTSATDRGLDISAERISRTVLVALGLSESSSRQNTGFPNQFHPKRSAMH